MPSQLSLVIPAHNEADRLEAGLERLRPVLDAIGGPTVEVLVIDDGSTDGTGARAAELYRPHVTVRVVRQEMNGGKGSAVRLGLALATGEKVVVCDADMAIAPRHIPEMVAALDRGPLVFGSRDAGGAIRYRSAARTIGGRLFNDVVRRRIGTTLRDTQCGFKGFRLGAGRLLSALGLCAGFAYDVEFIYLAGLTGLHIEPMAVTWDDVPGSSVNVARDARHMLADIWRIPRHSYACPIVRLPGAVTPEAVRQAAVAVRQHGLVLATADDAAVVLPRDAALAATSLAATLGGSVAVWGAEEFRGRRLEAV